jgi:hypothetical protein
MGPGFGGGSTERPTSLFADAIAALAARDGAAALEPFDGVVFIYAGAMQSRRGSSLWPHRSNVRAGGSSKPYYVVSEGGDRFGAIGVHCHEFGHMVGLPDQYGFGHRTGVGRFCTMAIGHQGGGASLTARPFQLCPWCKAQLDWLTPRVVDPRVPQRVRLRPVEGSTTECVKIPITPDAREYLLLEVRSRTGFDSDFPRPGLLVWRFGERGQGTRSQTGMSLDLVEAHGLDVFDASLREPDGVPWPWGGKRHYTPVTWPSSASAAPGAFEVHLTDIELEADGAVTFDLGLASRSRATVKAEPPPEGTVPEVEEAVDPITGETMKFRNRPRSPRIKVLPPAEDGGPK